MKKSRKEEEEGMRYIVSVRNGEKAAAIRSLAWTCKKRHNSTLVREENSSCCMR